ncbi:flagellin C-terminal helical region [Lachnospiraceae bacterium XBB1006]|nr:flagellin C-terminal helical region [Lachnospiraceae bacterium XBB1006]
MIIQYNLSAANANKSLGLSHAKKSKIAEKLASGYKINRAADDAAGLKISEKMRSQIRGLTQASNNIDTAINYVQVADGALSEVTEILQRIRELSVQASNDATLCVEDKQAIQDEISELTVEMERIFTDTEFNHKRIWQQPIHRDPPTQIGVEKQYAVTMNVPYSLPNTINNVNRESFPIDGMSYLLEADMKGITVKWTGLDGESYSSKQVPFEEIPNHSFDLHDYMDYSTYPNSKFKPDGIHMNISYTTNDYATPEEIVDGLNGVRIGYNYSSSENLTPYNAAGNPFNPSGVSYHVNINYKAEIAWDRDMEKADTHFMQGSVSNLHVPTTDNDCWSVTFTMQDDEGNQKEITCTHPTLSFSSNDGPSTPQTKGLWWFCSTPPKYDRYGNLIWSRYIGSYSDGTLGSFKRALSDSSDHGILTTSATKTGSIGMTFTLPDNIGSIVLTTSVHANDTEADVVKRISAIKGLDVYNSSYSNTDTGELFSKSQFGNSRNHSGYNLIDVPVYSKDINEYIALNIQSGANPYERIELRYKPLSNSILGVEHLMVDTYDHAQETLTACDRALTIVLGERSNFGAYQNRFEHAKSVNNISTENTQSAESILRDTDMAKEMMAFAKESILENAGVSLLAQANQQPQRILELLNHA